MCIRNIGLSVLILIQIFYRICIWECFLIWEILESLRLIEISTLLNFLKIEWILMYWPIHKDSRNFFEKINEVEISMSLSDSKFCHVKKRLSNTHSVKNLEQNEYWQPYISTAQNAFFESIKNRHLSAVLNFLCYLCVMEKIKIKRKKK